MNEGEGPPTSGKTSSRGQREVEQLRTELAARVAEAEWLKTHYDEQLRAAFAQVASLQSRLREESSIARAPQQHDPGDLSEIAWLKAEVERLKAAELRYLDRIEELKSVINQAAGAPIQ